MRSIGKTVSNALLCKIFDACTRGDTRDLVRLIDRKYGKSEKKAESPLDKSSLMVLKEAFRMQNHLTALTNGAIAFLSSNENVMRIKEEHQRSKRNPKAEDEIVEVKRDHDMTTDGVIDLLLDLMNERETLSLAISRAKESAEFDIDAAIAANKARQEAADCLKELARRKSSETVSRGMDYLINAEGNQTAYYYNVRSAQTIDYDRDKVRGIVKRLQRESDAVSTKIDLLNVTLEVDYVPKYDFESGFEDAYEQFMKTK